MQQENDKKKWIEMDRSIVISRDWSGVGWECCKGREESRMRHWFPILSFSDLEPQETEQI